MRWSDLGFVFFDCRVSLLLCGWWLIDSNWKKLAGCGGDTAASKRKRWQNHGAATGECAPTEVGIFYRSQFFRGPVPRHHLTTSEGFYSEPMEV